MSLLLNIRDIVGAAAIDAGSDAQLFAVPFDGMGQQLRFLDGAHPPAASKENAAAVMCSGQNDLSRRMLALAATAAKPDF